MVTCVFNAIFDNNNKSWLLAIVEKKHYQYHLHNREIYIVPKAWSLDDDEKKVMHARTKDASKSLSERREGHVV